MRIAAELKAFDGRHIDVLEALSQRYSPRAAIIRELLALAVSEKELPAAGATWLLKKWHEEGFDFTQSQTRKLLAILVNPVHWQPRLHVLQMLAGLSIPDAQKASVHDALMQCLNDGNKFVRAWAYNGIAVLATRFSEYRVEAAHMLEMGLRDETASVKARIRHILASTAPQPTCSTGG